MQMSFGTAYAVESFIREKTGIKQFSVVKNAQKMKMGAGRRFNAFTMSSLTENEMDIASKHLAGHMAKVMAMAFFASAILQYALSYMDDDKDDEWQGETWMGIPKKRLIWFNEPGHMLGVRLPWATYEGKRLYVEGSFLRDARQWYQIATGHLDRYLINKINPGIETLLSLPTAFAYGGTVTGKKIISDNNLPVMGKMQEFGAYAAGTIFLPFGVEPLSVKMEPEDSAAEKALLAVKYFGFSTSEGDPLQGTTSSEYEKMKVAVALKNKANRKLRDAVEYMPDDQAIDVLATRGASQSQIKAFFKMRHSKGADEVKAGRKAVMEIFSDE
jgi:hypothetical protein